MKIKLNTLLIILLLLCIFNSISATETRIKQLFITDEGKEYRHTFLYNTSGNVQLETKYIASEDDKWLNHSQTEWIYGSNMQGNTVLQIERVFENGAWKNTCEIQTQYNRVGAKSEETIYQYLSGNKTPLKKTKFEYSNGSISQINEYTFQGNKEQLSITNTFLRVGVKITQQSTKIYKGGAADSTFVSSFTYDGANNVKTQVVKKKIGNNYQPTDSITWFYDAGGMLVSQRLKKWNVKNNAWENTQMINYEYDADGNLVTETYQQWAGMYWKNIYRYEHLYENKVQTKRTFQALLYKEWRDMISIRYSDFYDNKARTMRSEYEFWGGDKGELTASHIPFVFNDKLVTCWGESIRISYDEALSGIANTNGELEVKAYPNPSNGIFYVSAGNQEILSWNVYDLKGQLVRSHTQRHNTDAIDLTDLQDGIYILQVKTSLGYRQQKLIKRK